MRILMIGDVVGKSGREAIDRHLPALRRDLDIDFAVVNGENAAHGFGITDRICARACTRPVPTSSPPVIMSGINAKL